MKITTSNPISYLTSLNYSNSLWEDFETCNKITTVVFHILTLGIPFLIYKIYQAYCLENVEPSENTKSSSLSDSDKIGNSYLKTQKNITINKNDPNSENNPNIQLFKESSREVKISSDSVKVTSTYTFDD